MIALPTAFEQSGGMSMLQIGLEWFPDGIGGGSSRMFSGLAHYLQRENVEVHGVVAGRSALRAAQQDGIRVFGAYNAPLIERLRMARGAVRDIVTAYRVELVASHFALYTAACFDMIKRLPLVVHFHGPWAAEARVEGASRITTAGRFLAEKLVYSHATKAIVLTRAFGDILHRTYGVPMERIAIIPGAVDIGRFRPSCSKPGARLRLGLPLDRPIVVSIRRLAKRMGLENLIASIAIIAREHPDVLLVIVGAGSLSDTLKRLVQERGLEEHVRFAGRVSEEDLPLYFRAAEISVVPSVALEGFGLVVAESLACGTPALVTPVGGLPEVVSALSEYLVLENSGPRAIASGIGRALTGALPLPSPDACVSYATAHFSWPIIAKQVRAAYGELP